MLEKNIVETKSFHYNASHASTPPPPTIKKRLTSISGRKNFQNSRNWDRTDELGLTGKQPTELARFKGHKKETMVLSLTFSPDGKTLASAGDDKTIRLWSLETKEPKLQTTLFGHRHRVDSVAYSADGKRLVSTGWDGRIIIWAADTGQKLQDWQLTGPVHNALFAPDGLHLATLNGNGTVYILRIGS